MQPKQRLFLKKWGSVCPVMQLLSITPVLVKEETEEQQLCLKCANQPHGCLKVTLFPPFRLLLSGLLLSLENMVTTISPNSTGFLAALFPPETPVRSIHLCPITVYSVPCLGSLCFIQSVGYSA